MLFASTAHITLGWAWHTAYRVRYHWSLRREGALAAAAVVVLVGAVDLTRGHGAGADVTARASAMVAASATTVLTEKTPPAVEPAEGPPNPIPLELPQTAEAAPSPSLDAADPASPQTAASTDAAPAADAIGQAIAEGKLYNDPVPATASVAPAPKREHARHRPKRASN